MIELLAGCGNSRKRKVRGPDDPEGWDELVTLDLDPNAGADVEFDLERLGRGEKLPFPDSHFDAIHLYDVLEHTGRQGDWRGFFAEFCEYWRVLKRDGRLIGKSPSLTSPWLWGDPGHKRVISVQCMSFLSQDEYNKSVGESAMCDYRHVYRADFDPVHFENNTQDNFIFVLRAVKPSRISP